MKIEIATLFPEMCEAVLGESIVGRARKAGKIEVHCRQIREYTQDKHRRVDDTPYGGGMGMVMQCEPIYNCYKAVCDEFGCKPHTIYMSPKGKVFTQQKAVELSQKEAILTQRSSLSSTSTARSDSCSASSKIHSKVCVSNRTMLSILLEFRQGVVKILRHG